MASPAPFPFSPPRTAPGSASGLPRLKILVADDDADVHFVTKIALKDFDFEGRRLEILGSSSTQETKDVLLENPDVAVIFLDVVMDLRDAGLRLVEWIRDEWHNAKIRIILRTGHPGDTPEYEIIRRYDINDYKVKTELTQQRLQFTLYSALRSWKDIQRIETSRSSLQSILSAGSELFQAKSLDELLKTILIRVGSLRSKDSVQQGSPTEVHGLIVSPQDEQALIVAAAGRYREFRGRDFLVCPELEALLQQMREIASPEGPLAVLESGLLIHSGPSDRSGGGFVFVETVPGELDLEQVSLLMSHFSLALDNFQLLQYVRGLQDDILFTISDVIERHFNESASHVRRVSILVAEMAKLMGWNNERTELARVAAIMHDLGKIGIPEAILKKAGPLTAEERKVMETHTIIGEQMLSRSQIPLFQMAARIARSHHENWDGSGYPDGLRGEQIPLEARMMALVDVCDALASSRVYKEAWPLDRVAAEMRSLVGKKFEPKLADLFLDNLEALARLVASSRE